MISKREEKKVNKTKIKINLPTLSQGQKLASIFSPLNLKN